MKAACPCIGDHRCCALICNNLRARIRETSGPPNEIRRMIDTKLEWTDIYPVLFKCACCKRLSVRRNRCHAFTLFSRTSIKKCRKNRFGINGGDGIKMYAVFLASRRSRLGAADPPRETGQIPGCVLVQIFPGKRYSAERIAAIPRRAERGMAVGDIVRPPGIPEQTFYRWRTVRGHAGGRCVS